MQLTTHGLMTPADLADHQQLTDTGIHPGCEGHYEDPGPLTYHSVADHCPGYDGEVQAYDLQVPAPGGAPEPMSAHDRARAYIRQRNGGRLTSRQRRRLVRKGAHAGEAVYRYDGMGYPASMRGYKYLLTDVAPVSGAPV